LNVIAYITASLKDHVAFKYTLLGLWKLYPGVSKYLDQLANVNIMVNIIHLPLNKLEVSTLKTNTLGEVVGLTWMIGMTLESQAIWQV
jgi:hypothetical protein